MGLVGSMKWRQCDADCRSATQYSPSAFHCSPNWVRKMTVMLFDANNARAHDYLIIISFTQKYILSSVEGKKTFSLPLYCWIIICSTLNMDFSSVWLAFRSLFLYATFTFHFDSSNCMSRAARISPLTHSYIEQPNNTCSIVRLFIVGYSCEHDRTCQDSQQARILCTVCQPIGEMTT